jgi:nitroreductase
MDTFETIHNRRAVRHYDANHVMPEEVLQKLFEAAVPSPTSFNAQPWRFVVVRDKELRQKIRKAATQPTLPSAIAWELANLHGGTVEQHASTARRTLEGAFQNLERKEPAVRQSRAVHAA